MDLTAVFFHTKRMEEIVGVWAIAHPQRNEHGPPRLIKDSFQRQELQTDSHSPGFLLFIASASAWAGWILQFITRNISGMKQCLWRQDLALVKIPYSYMCSSVGGCYPSWEETGRHVSDARASRRSPTSHHPTSEAQLSRKRERGYV